jgi:NDP-sugar pyrophosphorylase family protein
MVETPTQGLILAAGHGRRLRPITLHTPKPLMPFLGAPLMAHAAAHLARLGVRRIAVNTHHLAEAVARYVMTVLVKAYPDVQWHLSHEEELLGTGGALKKLEPWFNPGLLWVVNADAVFTADLAAMERFHQESRADATWMLTRAEHARALRVVRRDAQGCVVGIAPSTDEEAAVFCGVHLTSTELLGRLPDGHSCVVREGYLPWIADGARVQGWETEAFWADTGTPERVIDAHLRGRHELETFRAMGVYG